MEGKEREREREREREKRKKSALLKLAKKPGKVVINSIDASSGRFNI